jgi:hypothetical protein
MEAHFCEAISLPVRAPPAGARFWPIAISSSSRSSRLGKSAVGPDAFDATTDVACQ